MQIGLRESVFNLWLVHKYDAGLQDKTNNEFAELLLKVLMNHKVLQQPLQVMLLWVSSNIFYIFQQCFLVLDQVKCQLFYFFVYTGPLHIIQLLRVKHTLYHDHSFIQLSVQCLKKMKTRK